MKTPSPGANRSWPAVPDRVTIMYVRDARAIGWRCAVLTGALALACCQGVPDDKLIDLGDDDTADETDDGSTVPPAPSCDPVRQDCDDGDKCTALRSGDLQDRYNCVANDGLLGEGEACLAAPSSGQDLCARGLVCVSGSFEQTDGACLPLCSNDLQCDGGRCIDDATTGVRHCAPECSPFEATCPGTRQDCLSTQSTFACRYPGEGDQAGALDTCDAVAGIGCAAGLVCIQGGVLVGCGAAFCCTDLCDLDAASSPCAGALSCNDLGSDQSNVGACTVPQ